MNYEKIKDQRREAYLLASRSPWMLWRLQMLRAGYVPPLVYGQIPSDMKGIKCGRGAEEQYEIEPLIQQARLLKSQQRGLIPKLFTWIVVAGILIACLGAYLYFSEGTRFRVNVLSAIAPRNESNYSVWY